MALPVGTKTTKTGRWRTGRRIRQTNVEREINKSHHTINCINFFMRTRRFGILRWTLAKPRKKKRETKIHESLWFQQFSSSFLFEFILHRTKFPASRNEKILNHTGKSRGEGSDSTDTSGTKSREIRNEETNFDSFCTLVHSCLVRLIPNVSTQGKNHVKW